MIFSSLHKVIFAFLLPTALFTACDNKDYLTYDTQQKDALLLDYRTITGSAVDSLDYRFGFDLAESYELRIPLRMIGVPKPYDRNYTLQIVDSLSTMQMGSNYEINTDSLRIDAGKATGVIKLRLLRSKDPEILEKSKSLVFHIKENEAFRAFRQQTFKIVYSDIRPQKAPTWWDKWTLPPYNFELAQRFFYHFYRSEKINPTVFNERIQRFGHYFADYDKVRRRPGEVLLDNFVTRYAIMPLYEETSNNSDIKWPSKPSIY